MFDEINKKLLDEILKKFDEIKKTFDKIFKTYDKRKKIEFWKELDEISNLDFDKIKKN